MYPRMERASSPWAVAFLCVCVCGGGGGKVCACVWKGECVCVCTDKYIYQFDNACKKEVSRELM